MTVVAKNVTKLPAYPENLRFFDAIRDDKGSSSGRDGMIRIDCATEDGSPLPRTGLIAAGASVTGRVCLTGFAPFNAFSETPVPTWIHISAYAADLDLLEPAGNIRTVAEGGSWATPDMYAAITNARTEAGDTTAPAPLRTVCTAIPLSCACFRSAALSACNAPCDLVEPAGYRLR
ncbi:hypothetical protein [Nocardia suismassiliense]|uniref:hypothetical protein n=1 Tax=Nocardia suismassiliense TaxID=2077092 RepID=UPI00131F20D7|nr:hypothetical protein [Nocardia suismassiliense]